MIKKLVLLMLVASLIAMISTGCNNPTGPDNQVSKPVFNPVGGTYVGEVDVTITTVTLGTTILYTTDGSEPTSGSTVYAGPINIQADTVLKAKSLRIGMLDSPTANAAYTITPPTVDTPVIDPPGGLYTSTRVVDISCSTSGARIRYTIDGTEPTETSAIFHHPISVYATTTIKAKGYKDGWIPSVTVSSTYTIDPPPIEMVYISGGTFTMGDTRGLGSSNELPAHSVTLSPYYIGKYEVTLDDWHAVMGTNIMGDYPVHSVSWYMTLQYCNRRSIMEEFTPVYSILGSTNPDDWGSVPDYYDPTWDSVICDWNANGYRLPTEAEWEYAARGATNDPDYLYSGSDYVDAVAWYSGNCYEYQQTWMKAPNGIGTYDMSGNVFEWCWDWHSDSYYSSSPENNPTGPSEGSLRVIRGGSWKSNAATCRVTSRSIYYNHPYVNYDDVFGFRLCRAGN